MADIEASLAPAGTRLAPRKNLKVVERGLSVAAGTILGAWGARQRGLTGATMGLVGSLLVARGISGSGPLQRLVGERPDETEIAEAAGWSSAAVVSRAVTINAPREDVYTRFRDVSRWAEWAVNAEATVNGTQAGRLKFTTMGTTGPKDWHGTIVEDRKNELLSIVSEPGSDVVVTMRFEFRDAPGGRGTEIHGVIAYEPPGGSIGRYAAKLTQREPGIQLRRDLKRFKSLIEAGEIAVNDPQGAEPKA